ncbi:MAG: ABC transporter permease [Bacteroidales bacterium]|nr:ABC transporter permease [Bacteroidales bacterium]
MSIFRLILRNLLFFRRQHLLTALGIAVATAVLIGALIIGDSVKYSLNKIKEQRLGKIEWTIFANGRYFNAGLADSIHKSLNGSVSPVILAEAICINPEGNSRINRIQLIGINDSFPSFWNNSLPSPKAGEAILSKAAAEKLRLNPGDDFILKIHKPGKTPQNTPFVDDRQEVTAARFKLAAIAGDESMGRFSLSNNQLPPLSVFVSLSRLSSLIGMKNTANAILIEKGGSVSPDTIMKLIGEDWNLEDAGITITGTNTPGTKQLTTDQIFIDKKLSNTFHSIVPETQEILSYLVNGISTSEHSTPYSFVTAVDSTYFNYRIGENEILISDWLAKDLGVETGDSLRLRYYKLGPLRSLKEDSCNFAVGKIMDQTNSLFDRSLMPELPGISKAVNCRDWETGSPINLSLIRDQDEEYWKDYRGTPKAFISIEKGKEIWSNSYGNLTAFRFKTDSAEKLKIEKRLLSELDPSSNGFTARNAAVEGERAAKQSSDFGELFLGLSFFILIAAFLLTALLMGLQSRKRAAEIALLNSIGIRKRIISRILLIESLFVSLIGTIPGILLGILYNELLIKGLNTIWQPVAGISTLKSHLDVVTILTGLFTGFTVSFLTSWIVIRLSLKEQLFQAVKGEHALKHENISRKAGIYKFLAIIFGIFGFILLILRFINPRIAGAELTMGIGSLLLLSGIFVISFQLYNAWSKSAAVSANIRNLAIRSLSLRRKRSITSIILLALGAFSIFITASNIKPASSSKSQDSGTAGFSLWAESTLPIHFDLNSHNGRKQTGIQDINILNDVKFETIYRVKGDDASCLNLNQVSNPTLAGLNAVSMGERNSLKFQLLHPFVPQDNAWSALDSIYPSGIIPAFADLTVITWGLHRKLGDTLIYPDEKGNLLHVVLLGGLENSIFQGNVLVSSKRLVEHFPTLATPNTFLLDIKSADLTRVTDTLDYLLRDYGWMATMTSERIHSFNQVENTYLMVFILLGGLGLMIGILGMGVILIRNTSERRKEFAVMLSVGFTGKQVFQLLSFEFLYLIFSGLLLGTISAIIGLMALPGDTLHGIPWMMLILLFTLVFTTGTLSILLPAARLLRKSPVSGLRGEKGD